MIGTFDDFFFPPAWRLLPNGTEPIHVEGDGINALLLVIVIGKYID